MKKIIILTLISMAATGACLAEEAPEYIPGEVLIKFKPMVKQAAIAELVKQRGLYMINENRRVGIMHMQLPSGTSVEQAVNNYSKRNDVEFVQPNYIGHRTLCATTPNDTSFSSLWGLNNTGQTVNGTVGTNDADIDAIEAWDTQQGSASIIVAVIDTGIDWDHPDLSANIWSNADELDNGSDNDGNGYSGDIRGWDFVNSDNNPIDDHTHGTHVAGIIGATGNNSAGVCGVCWTIKIMPLKAFNAAGVATSSNLVSAINYAVNNSAKIIVASYSGASLDTAEQSAIESANSLGVLVVAAAGNGGDDSIGDNNDTTPQYPACYDIANIIAVTATDQNDALASFSDYGAQSVDVAAPGVNIYSTIFNDTYGFKNGTSMAVPYVSGIAALLLSQYSSYTPAQLKSWIISRVDAVSALSGKVASGGRVNANNCFQITPPTSFAATAGTSSAALSWTNSLCPRYASIMIRYRTDGAYPSSVSDGTLLLEASGTPGAAGSYSHTGLSAGTSYYYSAFSKDSTSTYSSAAQSVASIASADGGGGGGGGACFIITACYGDASAWPVRVFSCFRDRYLLTNYLGRYAVGFYYKTSPRIAAVIKINKPLKIIARFIIEYITPR